MVEIKMTTSTNLTNVFEYSKNFADLEEVKKEIKKVQSIKCRLKKMKSKESYQKDMTEIIKKEQLLKEVREVFEPKKLTVTTMTKLDIEKLDYDDTIRAIKSIQSKKCNSQFLEKDLNKNFEYQEAIKIESWLQEHKLTVKKVPENSVKKSELNSVIHNIENLDSLDKDQLLEMLKKLTN
jgi:hypothetical protein